MGFERDDDARAEALDLIRTSIRKDLADTLRRDEERKAEEQRKEREKAEQEKRRKKQGLSGEIHVREDDDPEQVRLCREFKETLDKAPSPRQLTDMSEEQFINYMYAGAGALIAIRTVNEVIIRFIYENPEKFEAAQDYLILTCVGFMHMTKECKKGDGAQPFLKKVIDWTQKLLSSWGNDYPVFIEMRRYRSEESCKGLIEQYDYVYREIAYKFMETMAGWADNL